MHANLGAKACRLLPTQGEALCSSRSHVHAHSPALARPPISVLASACWRDESPKGVPCCVAAARPTRPWPAPTLALSCPSPFGPPLPPPCTAGTASPPRHGALHNHPAGRSSSWPALPRMAEGRVSLRWYSLEFGQGGASPDRLRPASASPLNVLCLPCRCTACASVAHTSQSDGGRCWAGVRGVQLYSTQGNAQAVHHFPTFWGPGHMCRCSTNT